MTSNIHLLRLTCCLLKPHSRHFTARTPGITTNPWPPPQAEYLQVYLKEIGCRTVIVESHYIDRVFMHDDAVYYVRSLRSLPKFYKTRSFSLGNHSITPAGTK